MKGIAGTVVLYNPDERDLLHNIHSYLPYVELLIVIDNTEVPRTNSGEQIKGAGTAIRYIANNQNKGVAAALNMAAQMAFNEGYTWLLTMDQDSYFDKGEMTNYFSLFSQLFQAQSNIAIVSPSHEKGTADATPGAVFSEVTTVITSGSLMQLPLWNEAGGFCEKLFIDEVDHEYCYRLIERGYRIIQCNAVYLNHRLGTKKTGGYLGSVAKRERVIHSPRRVYFMVRNYLYVRKLYKKSFPEEFKRRDKEVMNRIKNNLFFSGHFWKNVKHVLAGYRHYKTGNFSNKL
ncbi:MAG TPA: glycosyltransferase [Niastella sp.]